MSTPFQLLQLHVFFHFISYRLYLLLSARDILWVTDMGTCFPGSHCLRVATQPCRLLIISSLQPPGPSTLHCRLLTLVSCNSPHRFVSCHPNLVKYAGI
jgi:hypothetical protein